MEIQIREGNITSPEQDLLLHVDFSRDTTGRCSFMAAVYEAHTQSTTTTGESPLFHSSGAGVEDAQDTLTFVDFWLNFNNYPDLDLEMAEWFFENSAHTKDFEPGRYQLRYKIRDKVAYIQNPGEPELGILPAHRSNSTNVVSI